MGSPEGDIHRHEAGSTSRVPRLDTGALAAWTLGFLPVLYLALRGGGYDAIVRSEVGLAACWIVLVGALAGLLPRTPLRGLAWTCVGLLAAFALWTGLAAGWSSSAERTVTELARTAAYLGFFLLALCVVRTRTVRSLLGGVAVAFAAVSVLAVLSRLYPGRFPSNQVAVFFPAQTSRLSYPLNYWNGTGNFLAIGVPLLLLLATGSRTLAGQALGAAAVPVAVLGVVLTASRGAVLTSIVGIVLFFILAPNRLPKFVTGLVVAGGSLVLITGLLHRHALRNALSTPAAVSQRHQLVWLLIVVCALVAAAQVAIALATRYAQRRGWLNFPRGPVSAVAAGALVVVLVVAIVVGAPGKLSHQWDTFKSSDATAVVSGNVYARLGNIGGSHRYQYWQAAVKAWKTKPVTGIGPGTFEFYWAQHGSIYEFVRNAHSLYLETLAELGVVGFLFITGLLLVVLGAGAWRALRAPAVARVGLAAATASFAAVMAAAAYDWMWQFAVVALVALLLAAGILSYRRDADVSQPDAPPTAAAPSPSPGSAGRSRLLPRGVLAVLAAAASVAIAIPFAAVAALRSSQSEARAGRLSAALSDALTAENLEPYAASPRVQQALIYERAGQLQQARSAIQAAVVREHLNWQIWLLRARIDAESGRPGQAVSDYRRAHQLNPLSPDTAL